MDDQYLEKRGITEKKRLQIMANMKSKKMQKKKKYNVADFKVLKTIGKGAFGQVHVVRKKDDNKVFAMKMMMKKEMIAKHQVSHIKAERDLLAAADNTWLVKLLFSF